MSNLDKSAIITGAIIEAESITDLYDALTKDKTFDNVLLLRESDVDDVPVDEATTAPISSNWAYDHVDNHPAPTTRDSRNEIADATILKQADVDDVPVSGATTVPISSNLAYNRGTIEGLTFYRKIQTLADEAEIVMPANVAGWGDVMIGDNQEWANFSFTSLGIVTLKSNSSNTVNTDTDGYLCIYDGGTGIKIKNRLGSSLTIALNIKYFTP